MNSFVKKRQDLKKHLGRFVLSLLVSLLLLSLCCLISSAASITFDLGDEGEAGSFGIIELLFLMTIMALAPSILIMMTSFTRVLIVLSFLRTAMGTQQSPPNQVLVGMALFLTLFIMRPVITIINETAYEPYRAGEITQEEFIDIASVPIKEFMLRQTYTNDLDLFLSISQSGTSVDQLIVNGPEDLIELDIEVIVPAFMTSEVKRAFNIGFLIFIPFLIIDIVVSSTLMSMGMVMLPPAMIAMPFKIMMFVVIDGWGLLFGNLVRGFE